MSCPDPCGSIHYHISLSTLIPSRCVQIRYFIYFSSQTISVTSCFTETIPGRFIFSIWIINYLCFRHRGFWRTSTSGPILLSGRCGRYRGFRHSIVLTTSLKAATPSGRIYWYCSSWLLDIESLCLFCYIFMLGKMYPYIEFGSAANQQPEMNEKGRIDL